MTKKTRATYSTSQRETATNGGMLRRVLLRLRPVTSSVWTSFKSQSFSPYIESNKIGDSENVVSSKKHTHVSNKNILMKKIVIFEYGMQNSPLSTSRRQALLDERPRKVSVLGFIVTSRK